MRTVERNVLVAAMLILSGLGGLGGGFLLRGSVNKGIIDQAVQKHTSSIDISSVFSEKDLNSATVDRKGTLGISIGFLPGDKTKAAISSASQSLTGGLKMADIVPGCSAGEELRKSIEDIQSSGDFRPFDVKEFLSLVNAFISVPYIRNIIAALLGGTSLLDNIIKDLSEGKSMSFVLAKGLVFRIKYKEDNNKYDVESVTQIVNLFGFLPIIVNALTILISTSANKWLLDDMTKKYPAFDCFLDNIKNNFKGMK